MTRVIDFLLATGRILIVVIVFVRCANAQQNANAPNVLVILADDLGYGDLQVYNPKSLVPTPHLDKLASEGIRLTDAYCPVSVCSPSRYALMTGQYSWRSWKKSGVMANYEPSMMDTALLTLPEMLQNAGYTTAGFGKWHLGATFPTVDGKQPAGYGQFRADDNGANLDLSRPVTDGPLDHGFDHWLGLSCPSELWILKDNTVAGAIKHDLYTIEAASGTDHLQRITLEDYLPFITEESLRFLQRHANQKKEQPFFLYFAPYVPHIPLAVSEEFRGTTEAGQYGDYVHELDHYVGKILNMLDSLKLTDNTIVLFASDNGSQFLSTSDRMDLSRISNSPGNVVKGNDGVLHHPNGVLRGTKWTPWEGGVRTPFIARWPGRFPPGAESNRLFALTDVMATIASAVHYTLPDHAGADSFNLLPVLMGDSRDIRKSVVVQSSKNLFGLRHGRWKYIAPAKDQPNPDDAPGELYDLSKDPSETVNLHVKNPRVAKQMAKELERILSSRRSVIR